MDLIDSFHVIYFIGMKSQLGRKFEDSLANEEAPCNWKSPEMH